MIVGSFYDGDDDMKTAWEQHDVYHDALRSIVGRCEGHVSFACSLLAAPMPERWQRPISDSFDHRTLQMAHDLLAAAWRFRGNSIQPALPFDGKPLSTSERMEAWLSWLRSEIAAWRDQPRLIALVMIILAEQNCLSGYKAEDELAARLKTRFADVPWRPREGRFGNKPIDDGADPIQCECPTVGRPPCNTLPCLTMAERANREGWGPLE